MARALEQLDAKIWGELPKGILGVIYAKLPMNDFFQLRVVCKDWNRLASNREFLEGSFKNPISEPYFFLEFMHHPWGFSLLAPETISNSWKRTRLPPADFGLAGILYNIKQNRIFNVHTRVFQTLPQGFPWKPQWRIDIFAMTVDTSVSPYSFQIIMGDGELQTQIYDSKSNSWTERLSKLPRSGNIVVISCALCNGFLYIRVLNKELDIFYIECYNLERDEWGLLQPPDGVDINFDNIGAWQNRLFVVEDSSTQITFTVWNLIDHSKQEWEVFARMPEHMRSWLNHDNGRSNHFENRATFCSEYVLFYTLVDLKIGERFVMCNLDKKVWEMIDLPSH